MHLSLIVATGLDLEIGKDNQLLWHLPTDLRLFKQTTLGHPILMGRRTYESIGRPLPGRQNLILSSQPGYQAPGCTVFQHLDQALAACAPLSQLFVIGGGTLYQQALPLADTLYITTVQARFEATVYFPQWQSPEWRLCFAEYYPANAKNPYPLVFKKYERALPDRVGADV